MEKLKAETLICIQNWLPRAAVALERIVEELKKLNDNKKIMTNFDTFYYIERGCYYDTT